MGKKRARLYLPDFGPQSSKVRRKSATFCSRFFFYGSVILAEGSDCFESNDDAGVPALPFHVRLYENR